MRCISSEREIDNYYGGFANQVLWPLCHIFATRCEFDPAYWGAYKRVNERFARTVCDARRGRATPSG